MRFFGLRYGVFVACAVALTSFSARADTYYVDGICGNDLWNGTNSVCAAPDGPKLHIQAMIADSAVVDDDEIVVAQDTYLENINFLGKAITVRSSDPNDPGVVMHTIIDGGGLGTVVTCNSGEGPDTVLSGFVITGGSHHAGGGMRNAGTSPTVTNCTFIENTAFPRGRGGGMFNKGGSPTVTNCAFIGNTAVAAPIGINGFGGGMYNLGANPTVTNCSFCGNKAVNSGSSGGGMYNNASSPTVTNCTFSANTAVGAAPDDGGGGMFNGASSTPTVTHCTFSGNMATLFGSGGGMLNDASSPTVTKCTFSRNTALGNFGGGMGNFNSSPTVTDCSFCANEALEGGGMANIDSFPPVTNCSFSGNTALAGAGGMENGPGPNCPGPILTNTGFCLNTPVTIGGCWIDGGGTSLDYCQPPRALCPADLNGDGTVNNVDHMLLLGSMGSCP